jgi:acyl-coenzyme A synthetase/AMP-(fatty) acid ligase
MNIIDPILFQCRLNAEQPAICAPGTKLHLISYAQLEFMINNLTQAMLSLGFESGQIVGILVQDKIFHIALMLALTRIGAVTVSCVGPSLPQEIGAVAVISDSADQVAGAKRVIRTNAEWLNSKTNAVIDPRMLKATGDEICRIVLTSGSTGVSKGVAFSHRALLEWDSQLHYCYGNRWPQCSRLYCDVSLSSKPALGYLLHMLMRGGMIFFYGADAISTEQSLELFKVQNMVTTPRGLAEHLKLYENTPIRCYLDHILVVGGTLTKELSIRTWARLCPHLLSSYGATEVGSIATADARDIVNVSGAAGYILPGVSVESVDESGNPLGPNREGNIRIRTPFMAVGYVGQPDASARAFRDGWFYPGDYGHVTEEGLLVITEKRSDPGG